MMMLKCDNCGRIFDEENAVRFREDWGEYFLGSPCCGYSFYEVELCDDCETEMVENDDGDMVCPKCGKEVSKWPLVARGRS